MQNFDAKQQTDLVILDFSKAFDTVPHKKLLFKLSKYGITGNINKWIQCFLVLRKQQVIVEGESSKPCSVDSGVPQRSVLGPLLFLCHINDLPHRVTSKVRLFADDCLLYRPMHSPRDQLQIQQDLAALETWAEDLGMRFNVSKCYLMSIHRSKHPYSSHYKLDNHILEQVEENPYLGLTIHKSLKWASHINKISNKGFVSMILYLCGIMSPVAYLNDVFSDLSSFYCISMTYPTMSHQMYVCLPTTQKYTAL